MLDIEIKRHEIAGEIDRICTFINSKVKEDEKVVVGVSGGIDSDVVARLAFRSLGAQRVKLFIVIQEGMDPNHLTNARELAIDLGISLVEINLEEFPFRFIQQLEKADPSENFRHDGLIDPSRAKCSIRTAIFSTYLDRGYLVLGCSNRTELETGFFLPLGDGLGHIKPIVHLYKTQVFQIASELGASKRVREQPASSGFWLGAEDLEDLAFWLYNEAPIGEQIDFSQADIDEALNIRSELTTEKVDMALFGLSKEIKAEEIASECGLPIATIVRLGKLTKAALRLKRRPLNSRLENLNL